ncbi:MAG TPA: dihydrodipicolinate synthase family protein [Vicinamibacteria bacterium]|nr:dihydrodipicolinate synthase family protein [Vicinamibacteria bacterium]
MKERGETRDPGPFRSKLGGVIAFPVTPFREDLSLDLPGLRRNLRALVEHPVCAVVAAGGTGELYSLTPAEHAQVVGAMVEETGGRVPVIAGVGFGHGLAVEMAEAAARGGAEAILALPPYYPNADEQGLLQYYEAIGRATPRPLLVYSRDSVNPGPEWVERLAARVPTLTAWKEGQGDIRRCQQIMARLGDRLHWIGGAGDDCVPGYYSIGIRTYTSSIATVAPRLSLQLHEAGAAGDAATLGRLMELYVVPLYGLRSRRRGYEVSVMKEMMNELGMAAGPVRPPLPALTAEDRAEVQALLRKWQPVL